MGNETITETEFRLTTFDNPYDPFDDFTCGYLDRVSHVSDDMSQKEATKEIERAIDEIIEVNPLNIYKKVKREVTVVV